MADLICLPKNKFTIVDSEDFEWLNQWKWALDSNKWTEYVYRLKMVDRKITYFSMHREILKRYGANLNNLSISFSFMRLTMN